MHNPFKTVLFKLSPFNSEFWTGIILGFMGIMGLYIQKNYDKSEVLLFSLFLSVTIGLLIIFVLFVGFILKSPFLKGLAVGALFSFLTMNADFISFKA